MTETYWKQAWGNRDYPDNDEPSDPPRHIFGRRLTNREVRTGCVVLNPDAQITVHTEPNPNRESQQKRMGIE